jgi:hypothetical protein
LNSCVICVACVYVTSLSFIIYSVFHSSLFFSTVFHYIFSFSITSLHFITNLDMSTGSIVSVQFAVSCSIFIAVCIICNFSCCVLKILMCIPGCMKCIVVVCI